jgi:hypothetical protein
MSEATVKPLPVRPAVEPESEPKPKAKKPKVELPPVGSAARKAMVLQGLIKE